MFSRYLVSFIRSITIFVLACMENVLVSSISLGETFWVSLLMCLLKCLGYLVFGQ